MATGFHWTYGVVEQASSAGAGASPLVGMSALNLGSTNPMSGGGGAGSPAITMIPNGAGIFGSEHTVKLSISYSGNDPDPTSTLGGGAGLDAVFANGNKIIDVVASNAQGGLSTTNEFYIIFQELALQGNAGGTTGGGFDATEFQNGAQVTFTLQATNTNGQTNQTTSTVTMA